MFMITAAFWPLFNAHVIPLLKNHTLLPVTDVKLCLIHLCIFKPNTSLTKEWDWNECSVCPLCSLPFQPYCLQLPLENFYVLLSPVTLPWGGWAASFLSIVQAIPKPNMSSVKVTQSCPTLCDPMSDSRPGSSVHGILQAGILEWVVILFSRGSSQPRDRTQVFHIAGRLFISWATREAQHVPYLTYIYLMKSFILESTTKILHLTSLGLCLPLHSPCFHCISSLI